jgi:hypothetical protein
MSTNDNRGWGWKLFDGAMLLALVGFGFYIGGLNQKVESHSKLLDKLQENVSATGVKVRDITGDKPTEMHTRKQFQFMTPSTETWKAKQQFYAGGREQAVTVDQFKWQEVTDEKIDDFGKRLISEGFTLGWRRYPYLGQGRYRDVGWWWVMTVDPNFDIARFVKFYTGYWGTPEIYLEEFDTGGDVMPEKFIPHPNLPTEKKR